MGRTTTPKYVVQIDKMEPMEWKPKTYGKPSAENLERFVMKFAKSLEPGGVNEALSQTIGFVPYPKKAIIRFNYAGGRVVADWKAGLFQVYGD